MKKLRKDIVGFTGANLAIGVGAVGMSKAGFSGAGLESMSNMMPTTGTVMMGGHLMRMVKGMGKKRK